MDNNLITFVPQQGAFIVQGRKGKYCVTLFPKEKCQCETTSTGYHILATKMSVGLIRTSANKQSCKSTGFREKQQNEN